MSQQQVIASNSPKTRRWLDVVKELLGCWALAFGLSLFYEPMHTNIKWLVYAALNALAIPVLLPYVPLFLIALLFSRIRGKNWWSAHRIAIIGTLLWVLIGSYGMWITRQP
jgi:hypothetical protein